MSHINIGRWQFILWWTWQLGWREWAPAYWPIYGKRALFVGPLEIRRFAKTA